MTKTAPRPRYTLTARHEGRWRWATVNDATTDRSAINRAKKLVKVKMETEPDGDDPEFDAEGVEIWNYGGITLANRDGHIIWTRVVQPLPLNY